ncbi:MAG: immunoglobulin domain-containing protein [Verrucomicrobiales bacterium]|nr:immunoglobulin domain-containing protein [Verrucomicrobiales bacterium]
MGALGMPPLSYQWYKYGVAIAGASGTTLVLSNVLGADAGNYHAVVSTAYGSVTSAVAALSVIDPVILRHPTNQTVSVGMRATFTITAIGTEPLRYQWYFNTNTPLPGATNAVLTLENVQPEQAGVYSVVVSNALGAAQSAFAELKVGPLPQCAQALDGLVGWWQAEGDKEWMVSRKSRSCAGRRPVREGSGRFGVLPRRRPAQNHRAGCPGPELRLKSRLLCRVLDCGAPDAEQLQRDLNHILEAQLSDLVVGPWL